MDADTARSLSHFTIPFLIRRLFRHRHAGNTVSKSHGSSLSEEDTSGLDSVDCILAKITLALVRYGRQ